MVLSMDDNSDGSYSPYQDSDLIVSPTRTPQGQARSDEKKDAAKGAGKPPSARSHHLCVSLNTDSPAPGKKVQILQYIRISAAQRPQNMAEHTYKFNVTMTCSGCSGAVTRVLNKLDGVKSYDVSLDSQTATVIAEPSLAYETVLKTIKKTGKKVNSGEVDGEEKSIDLPEE